MAKKKFGKDIILNAAFDICKDVGLNALSMRMLAKKLGCSVMPIYDSFESKEDLLSELKQFCVIETLVELESDTLCERYIKMVNYGLEYPQFFLDFVDIGRNRQMDSKIYSMLFDLMRKDERLKNLSDDQLSEINAQMEIFIMGLIFFNKDSKKTSALYETCKYRVLEVANSIISKIQ